MSTKRRSFWSTIPGLITGLAGILTGLVGLGTLLVQTGVIGDDGDGSTPKPGETPVARFTVSPTSVELNADEKTAPLTVENTGTTVLSFQQPVLNGAQKDQFTVTSRCAQVQPGDTCTVTVTFKGLLEGSATLTIRAGGGASAKDVPVEGKLL